MTSKYFQGNTVEVLDFLYLAGKSKTRVFTSLIKNAPYNTRDYHIFLSNGIPKYKTSWVSFAESLYLMGKEGIGVHMDMIKDNLLREHPSLQNRQMIVEYLGDEVKQGDVILGDTLVYSDIVKAKSENNAEDFKKWLTRRVKECNIDYTVDMEKGVNKIIKEIRPLL